MPSDVASDSRFQIGHVLFMDIVGYSKLLVNDQAKAIHKLSELVQATEQFRLSGKKNKLLRLATGDGMALVFRDSPESPVRCALELGRALRKEDPPLPVRMGIHSGLVHGITDVNNRLNVAGAGINIAQRVMDCGDDGHILLSRHVAEDLENDARWRPLLHELGECEVKHRVRVGLVNIYDSDAGNPQLPLKIRRLRKKNRTNSVCLFGGAIALSVLAAGGTWLLSSHLTKRDHLVGQPAEASPSSAASTPTESTERDVTFVQTDAPGYPWPSPLAISRRPAPSQKQFAGTWRGTIYNTGPGGSSSLELEFTVDETEKHFSHLSSSGSVTRRGRILCYSRSYKLGGTSNETRAELTLQDDGKTAIYKKTETSVTGKMRSRTSGTGTVTKAD